jgi:hypothetical protein
MERDVLECSLDLDKLAASMWPPWPRRRPRPSFPSAPPGSTATPRRRGTPSASTTRRRASSAPARPAPTSSPRPRAAQPHRHRGGFRRRTVEGQQGGLCATAERLQRHRQDACRDHRRPERRAARRPRTRGAAGCSRAPAAPRTATPPQPRLSRISARTARGGFRRRAGGSGNRARGSRRPCGYRCAASPGCGSAGRRCPLSRW